MAVRLENRLAWDIIVYFAPHDKKDYIPIKPIDAIIKSMLVFKPVSQPLNMFLTVWSLTSTLIKWKIKNSTSTPWNFQAIFKKGLFAYRNWLNGPSIAPEAPASMYAK